MKYFKFISSILVCIAASALSEAGVLQHPHRIVLLSSIYNVDEFGRDKSYEGFAKMVYEKFESFQLPTGDFDIRVVHDANQVDLYNNLHDPENLAVFWISHANSSERFVGTSLSERIVDSQYVDIAPIFQEIHPNIKWLGLIGCKTRQILEKYALQGAYLDNAAAFVDTGGKLRQWLGESSETSENIHKSHGLIIDASESPRIAEFSLSNSLEEARKYLEKFRATSIGECRATSSKGLRVRFYRKPDTSVSHWLDTVRISVKGRPIAMFATTPPMTNNNSQEVFVPWELDRPIDELKFVIDSGTQISRGAQTNLGNWEIKTLDGRIQWSVLKVGNRALGGSENVYLPKIGPNVDQNSILIQGMRFPDCKAQR